MFIFVCFTSALFDGGKIMSRPHACSVVRRMMERKWKENQRNRCIRRQTRFSWKCTTPESGKKNVCKCSQSLSFSESRFRSALYRLFLSIIEQGKNLIKTFFLIDKLLSLEATDKKFCVIQSDFHQFLKRKQKNKKSIRKQSRRRHLKSLREAPKRKKTFTLSR